MPKEPREKAPRSEKAHLLGVCMRRSKAARAHVGGGRIMCVPGCGYRSRLACTLPQHSRKGGYRGIDFQAEIYRKGGIGVWPQRNEGDYRYPPSQIYGVLQ